MIEVKALSKTFKVYKKEEGLAGSLKSIFNREWVDKHALKDVNLSITEGEILGLIGSNGAGKTTLVKILSGIIHRSSGEVSVMGFDPWKRDNEMRRQMALIMGQKAQLWWDLPAADCFLLLKEIYQLNDNAYKESLDELMTALDIRDQINIPIRRLSLGERMKTELIASLLHRPKIVYLDEPTIGLDISAQKAIRKFILDYREKYNPCMILTSHYMEDIETLCRRVALLKEGSIVYDGTLSSITDKYSIKKKIIISLENSDNEENILQEFPNELGTPQKVEGKIEIKVKRAQIGEALGFITSKYSLNDLVLQEVDIADIIESLMS